MTGGAGGQRRVLAGIDARVVALLVATVVLALSGLSAVAVRGSDSRGPVSVVGSAGRAGVAVPAVGVLPTGDPLRIRIPSIGVDVRLVPLGVNADGSLEVPRFEDAGWYARGPRPGEVGPAVVAAHLDSKTGPAVFYRLRELGEGAAVYVDYRDAVVAFVVRTSESFSKAQFPTRQVYGPTATPELRLISCDGKFDRRARSYASNLIVWAGLTPIPARAA
ncbi:MAG: class F sortase [Acidimicrobiales bacterium]